MGMRAAEFWRSRKRRWLVGAAVVVLAIGIARWWTHESEPSWEGKPLSEWLTLCSEVSDEEEAAAAANGLRAIGTNALPTLLSWMQYEEGPSPWRDRLWKARSK